MRKVMSGVVAAVTLSVLVFGPTARADKDDDHRPAGDAGAPAAPPPPTTAHGTNFQVKNGLDNNFCMDVAAGSTEGRALTLSPCTAAASQRWGFTWNSNDTNSVIDSQGMCVDAKGRKTGDGVSVVANKCHHGEAQKFTFTSTGHIIDIKTKSCLSVPRATGGAAVFLEACDDTKKQQNWKLAQ
jgi:hypothetical protein